MEDEIIDNGGEAVNTPNPGDVRKSTTKNLLGVVGKATGEQFNSVEELVAWSVRNATAAKTVEPVQDVQPRTDNRPGRSNVEDQIRAMQEAMARKDAQLRERDLDSTLRNSMGDTFEPELAEFVTGKVRDSVKWVNDQPVIVDGNGNTRYNMETGEPMSLADALQEIGRKYPKTLKSSTPTGSGAGLRGGSVASISPDSIPDYSTDPAAFNLWAKQNGFGKGTGLSGMRVQTTSSFKR